MFGKGALIMVFGFALNLSVYQLNLRKSAMSTYDNFKYQYVQTMVHETALSVMNMGIHKIWKDNFTSGSFNVTSNGYSATFAVSQIGGDTVQAKVNAWGYVYDEDYYAQTSQTLIVQDSIIALFAYGMPISRYFWFTKDEKNLQWATSDTAWGRVHTNKVLNISGSPVFLGKVTSNKGISPDPAGTENLANFLGGWEIGINNPIPTDTTPLINAATSGNGGASMNTKSLYDENTTFQFLASGSVIRIVNGGPPDTVLITDIAPTGVIYSEKDVRVKGVVNGQLTILSKKKIWIDDDIVYADDPTVNSASDDLLGLVAKKEIFVTDNSANNNDCNIQACLMSWDKKFEAQNYSTRGVSGNLNIYGSIVQKDRGKVNLENIGFLVSGFEECYYFDDRLNSMAPPVYPEVSHIRMLSWWEF